MLNKDERNLVWLLMAAVITFIFFLLMTRCGLEPSHKVIEVDVPVPPDPVPGITCDGVKPGNIKQKKCQPGYDGIIIDYCLANGKWEEKSNNCKQICNDSQLAASSSVITFENKIKFHVEQYCLECHGSYLQYDLVSNLVDKPFNGMIAMMESGEMPPQPLKPVPVEVLEDFRQWVEDGKPESGECAVEEAFIDQQKKEDAILNHLASIDERDRPFYRYFDFTYLENLGRSTIEMKVIDQMLNQISLADELIFCRPVVGLNQSLCAIDIREYDQTLVNFAQIENAIGTPFISNTTTGQLIRQLTRTNQPIFHGDEFLDTIMINAELYYDLLKIDESLAVFFHEQGIDIRQALIDNDYSLIGTDESLINAQQNTRLIGRFETRRNGKDGFCWLTWDNGDVFDAQQDLFQAPFIANVAQDKLFFSQAMEVICNLDNGLLLFALYADTDNSGVPDTRANFAPTNIVTCDNNVSPGKCIDSEINNVGDCLNCHSKGIWQKKDKIGSHIRQSGLFDANEREIARQIYKSDNVNNALFSKDNAHFNNAMKQIGVSPGGRPIITDTNVRYRLKKDAKEIAAYFGVKEAQFKACIRSSAVLNQKLGGLLQPDDVISHNSYLQVFNDILIECRFLEDQP